MKIKRLLPAAAVVMALMLTACGEDPNAIHYALLTGTEGISGSMLTDVQSGIETAAAAQGVNTSSYMASSEDNEGYRDAFSAAEDDGVYYVICAGESMEIPVYEAQEEHKDLKYILIDGEPRVSETSKADIRGNTMCVILDKPSQGYLAGYAAVREGKRTIAFIAGESGDTAGNQFIAGFINGVGSAVSALGIDGSSVNVYVEYAGDEYLSPMRMADALSFYQSGTDLIVTNVENFTDALTRAAAREGGKIATVGFDASGSSDTVLYSVIPNYSGTVERLLDEIHNDKGFDGGSSLTADAGEDAIAFVSTYSNLSAVSESDIDTILASMADGSASVYSSSDEDSTVGIVSGLTSQGLTVNVSLKEPTAISAETGLSGGSTENAASESEAGTATEGDEE